MRHTKWIALAALLTLAVSSANAQFLGPGWWHAAAPAYVGPGDVVAMSLWSGMRAYSAATRGTAAVNICSESGGSDVTCEDELTNATTGKLVLGTVGSTCSSVTCTIKIFYDQTGNNFCSSVACNFTQTTVANRATFLITGCPGTSGQPCAFFNSSTNAYLSAGSNTVSQPVSDTAVAERSGGFTSNQTIIGSSVSPFPAVVGFDMTANTAKQFGGATAFTAAAADSALHSLQAAFDSNVASGSTFDVDGTPNASTMDSISVVFPLTLGNLAGGQPLQGYFMEGGFKNALFSSGDMSALTSNQRAFWGF